jgi:membrane protein DedA with SNARE-associated domain
MNLFWFEVYSLVGSIGYAGLLVGIGWFLGANFRQGLAYLGAFSWIVFAAIVVGGIFLWIGKRRHDRKLLSVEAAEWESEHGGRLGQASEGDADDDA